MYVGRVPVHRNSILFCENPFQHVYNNLEEEVKRLNMGPETIQKTKKPKQAVDVSSRKVGEGGGNNKENVDRTNAMDSEESSIMDSTATGRPIRARKTRVATLVSQNICHLFRLQTSAVPSKLGQ